MKLSELSTVIQNVVTPLANTLYLRATDVDANIDIDHLDIQGKTIVIFNNLPAIDYLVSKSGHTEQVIPVEIRVLKLANLDDNTVQGDTLRDQCAETCDTIWDMLTANQDIDGYEYQVTYLNEVKVYDKTMTGARLIFPFTSTRTTYAC